MLQGHLKALPSRTRSTRIAVVATFAPRRCGIAKFTASLLAALQRVAPQHDIEVVRLVDSAEPEPDAPAASPVTMAFDPNCPVSVRTASRHLDRADVVIIQHEYGIYGDHDGMAVVDLVDQIRAPIVTVLHTVLTSPSPRQRLIVRRLAEAGHIVVPSRAAQTTLESVFGLDRTRIDVIPHGSPWTWMRPNPHPRRRLITWGLLGPGKGLERAIEAVAKLEHLDPPLHYQIVGQTHPMVLRQSGQAYRQYLQDLVATHGLENNVEFVDCYLDDTELYRLVTAADVVLTPYDNSEQISSGVLAEAVAAGRPVVATRFPHAVELLSGGAGIVVAHDDVEGLADALQLLLENRELYDAAAEAARASSAELSWDSVGREYERLLASMTELERITA